VYARDEGGRWRQFDAVTCTIAREPADPYIVYREMNVIYRKYTKMRICQSSIEDYEKTVVLDNRSFTGCMNCHTFLNNGTDRMVLHMRAGWVAAYGSGMLLFEDEDVSKVDTRTQFNPGMAAFSSWHPSGRVLAYSINKVRQFFHAARTDVREGFDLKSDLALYHLDSGTVSSTPHISDPDRLETWPAWSADGKHLYYCSTADWWRQPEEWDWRRAYADAARVRYDLMRIPYDVETDSWGEPETVLSAQDLGLSIAQPRPSPDGRFLAFTATEHGSFPTLEPRADIHLMDLESGDHHRLASNSDRCESWHSWSSNSRWLVFSSKRDDGLFIRPYFTHIDRHGKASKPFVLPQKDPHFYDTYIRIYQLPEFVKEPVRVTGERLGRVIRTAGWHEVDVTVTSATPMPAARSPDARQQTPPLPDPWTRAHR
ncbi:MAG: PD40 domain-containing protein, partial [Candidatus Brocadiae bacterium]|nr:PD40 domain-containing protein [Candidatus Brocadiia bacterium]